VVASGPLGLNQLGELALEAHPLLALALGLLARLRQQPERRPALGLSSPNGLEASLELASALALTLELGPEFAEVSVLRRSLLIPGLLRLDLRPPILWRRGTRAGRNTLAPTRRCASSLLV